MHAVHRLNKLQKNQIKNNHKRAKMISMMITVKSQSMLTKMDNLNGFVLSSLSQNKTQKLPVSDLSQLMRPKELIDSEKEVQALLMQALKFTVLRKLSVTRLESLLKALELIMLSYKMLQITVLHMSINSTLIGSRI